MTTNSKQAQDAALIELGAPSLGDAEKRALCAVIDDGWLTMGERVRRFEELFAAMHGASDAVAVNSATAALHLSLQVFDVGRGDEVLVPSLTFVAASNVVVHCGATPVFVDIDGVHSPHLSMADAQSKLTARTKAVMLMHYGGFVIDVVPWREFADRHRLLLLEDAAHTAGMPGMGTLSDAASFSFFTNKNMTTAEGGMLIVRDAERRQRARALRGHGMTASTLDRTKGRAVGYDVIDVGHNFRMDELRAAIGLVQIETAVGLERGAPHAGGALSPDAEAVAAGSRGAFCRQPRHVGPHHAGAVAGRGRPAARDAANARAERADQHALPADPHLHPLPQGISNAASAADRTLLRASTHAAAAPAVDAGACGPCRRCTCHLCAAMNRRGQP